jgi:hypothetical protein
MQAMFVINTRANFLWLHYAFFAEYEESVNKDDTLQGSGPRNMRVLPRVAYNRPDFPYGWSILSLQL